MLLFLFISWVLQYGNLWHSQRSMRFILVTKEIRLFHLKVLLSSKNICSYCTDELGNGIGRIFYIVLSESRKNAVVAMKIFDIVLLKNLDATTRGS